MAEPHYVAVAVVVAAAVTWSLRAVPFAVLRPLRGSPAVRYLGTRLPPGVLVILLGYCLRGLPLADPGRMLAPLLALCVTVGLHLWRHEVLLSVAAGTVVHVTLASGLLTH